MVRSFFFLGGFANPESSDDWQWLIKLRSYLNPVPGVSWISSVYTCDYNI